jgi:hypothetical protein
MAKTKGRKGGKNSRKAHLSTFNPKAFPGKQIELSSQTTKWAFFTAEWAET